MEISQSDCLTVSSFVFVFSVVIGSNLYPLERLRLPPFSTLTNVFFQMENFWLLVHGLREGLKKCFFFGGIFPTPVDPPYHHR